MQMSAIIFLKKKTVWRALLFCSSKINLVFFVLYSFSFHTNKIRTFWTQICHFDLIMTLYNIYVNTPPQEALNGFPFDLARAIYYFEPTQNLHSGVLSRFLFVFFLGRGEVALEEYFFGN